MHIGFDIDGVISKRDYTRVSVPLVKVVLAFIHRFFPLILRRWALSQPLQDKIEIAQEMSRNHTISIITARPPHLRKYTAQWLKNVAHIEYHKLYCVGLDKGFGQRKLDIAKRIELDMFLDDTPETIALFRKEGIPAQLFTRWEDVMLDKEEKY